MSAIVGQETGRPVTVWFVTPPASTARVTVGIVSYRHSRYITQALDSTLDQGPCAVIVSDDASPDDTQDVIRRWYGRLPPEVRERVTLRLSPTNRGLPVRLNDVLAQVTTPYFVYLAGDDWHLTGRLARQADVMDATGADLSYGDAARADEHGRLHDRTFYERHPRWRSRTESDDPFATLLLEGNWIAAPTVMFRTESLRAAGGFDEAIAYEDQDSYTRVARRGSLVFIPGPPLAVHREISTSLGNELFHERSLRWVEGIARTELKHLDARKDLDVAIASRAFAHVIRAYKLGADPRWVADSLDVVRPYLAPPPRSWRAYRLLAGARVPVHRARV